MKTVLIRNTSQVEETHFYKLNQLLKRANEIHIAVAFVKVSGIKLLEESIEKAVNRKVTCRIIAGLHFGLTEPIALNKLNRLLNKTASQLYLARNTNNEVFHPKMYLIRIGKIGHIITGSANLTSGGLKNNFECSLWVEADISEPIWQESLEYFDELCSESVSQLATKVLLDNYGEFYVEQQKSREKTKATPTLNHPKASFNYDKLIKKFEAFNHTNRNKDFELRMSKYDAARDILDKMISKKTMLNTEFRDLLDELVGGSKKHKQYWSSNGLFRGKTGRKGGLGVYDKQKEFNELVKFVKENREESEEYVFGNGMKLIQAIPYVGVNYLTEIMMTYNYHKFANLNKNPLTVLNAYTSLNLTMNKQNYSGKYYAQYCGYVTEIMNVLGIRNMLEVDSFFNDNYQVLKRSGKSK